MKVLKVNGKDYPVLPGWAALKMFAAKRNLEFHELFDYLKSQDFEKTTNQLLEDFALLSFCFIERGCAKSDTVNDLSIDDLIDWLGREKKMAEIVSLIYDSYGVEVAKETKSTKKKNLN